MDNEKLKKLAFNKFPSYPAEVINRAMEYLINKIPYSILYSETDKRIEEVFNYIHWVS